jgi:O-antigen/teichoic acid export membrane protein
MRLHKQIVSIFDAGNSLKKKVLIGSFWLYLLQGFTGGVLILQTIILARLLTPKNFGIVAIFFIISGALEGFTNTGFQKALIQRKKIDNNFMNTAWSVSILRGIVLFCSLFFTAPILADLFDSPRSGPVIRVLSITLLLKGFYNIGTIYFTKDLEFQKQFILKGSGILANILISIPLAFLLRNEWAIVWGMVAADATTLLMSFTGHPYRPKFSFDHLSFLTLFNYGKWLFLSSVVIFFIRQGDKIFIAKLLGITELGIYTVAWRFAKIPELLAKPLPNVLFPAYSKIQNEARVLKARYLQALKLISLFSFPLVGGMIFLAKPFTTVFIGTKWLDAVIPMQLLTLAVGINIIIGTSYSLFNAMGKTSYNLKVNSVKLGLFCLCVYPLVSYQGVIGASICYILLSIAAFIIWKIEIYKLIMVTLRDLHCIVFSIMNTFVLLIMLSYPCSWIKIDGITGFLFTTLFGVLVWVTTVIITDKLTGGKIFKELIQISRTFEIIQ